MNRFVNHAVRNYYSSLIANTTDECRPVYHGVSRGNSESRYAWVADMMHKHPGNNATNSHRAYVSFFSDQEMIHQEYAFDPALSSAYPFLSTRQSQMVPPVSYELSSKQYARVSQKRSEVDSVDYINESMLRIWIDQTSTSRNIHINHDYDNVGIYHAEGYRVRWDGVDGVHPCAGYSESLFVKNGSNHLSKSGSSFSIQLPGRPKSLGYDDINNPFNKNLGWDKVDFAIDNGYPVERFFGYKIDVANQESQSFIDKDQWVMYPPQYMVPVDGGYVPSIGIMSYYDMHGLEMASTHPRVFPKSIFFPETVIGGQYEPFKIIADVRTGHVAGLSGKMYFNPMCCMGDSSDQSRLVFNICKYQTSYDIETYEMVVRRRNGGIVYIDGIDLETERNRRFSSVVMTEPYFVTKPIGRGEIAYYQFVGIDGIPVSYNDPSDFEGNPTMFLRIKASSEMISEIEKSLIVDDRNHDIINTFTMKLVDALAILPLESLTYYESFNGPNGEFFQRQDDCLDDLVGSIFTARNYYKFYISVPATSPVRSLYSDGKARIVGMGMSTMMVQGQNGQFSPESYVHFYCSNHSMVAPAEAGQSGDPSPLANIEVELIAESRYPSIVGVANHERFTPMIKLPGINGYIKIINRSQAFTVKRADDGKIEVIYHVEFPYCPGSYIVRSKLNEDNAVYQPTQVLIKESYIDAGNCQLDGSTYDETNLRHQFGDTNDMLTSVCLYQQSHADVKTAIEADGGEIDSTSKKSITYPSRIVYEQSSWKMFDIVKPMYPRSSHHTTINLFPDKDVVGWEPAGYWSYGDVASVDLKLVVFSDNRRWLFDQNKYCSFIARENPSYLFEIDSAALFNNYGKSEYSGCGMPDFKRWCHSYFTGVSSVFVTSDVQDANDPADRMITPGVESTLLSLKSGSSLVLEAWDSEANGGCWRPVCQTGFDDNKIPGELLIGELHYKGVLARPEDLDLPSSQFYMIKLGIIRVPEDLNDPDTSLSGKFPPETDTSLFADVVNKVLYNSETNQSFHVAHSFYDVGTSPGAADEIILIVNMIDSDGNIVNPATLPAFESYYGWKGKLQLRAPGRQMSKGVFEMSDAIATGENPNGFVKRYMDMRDDSPGGGISRYVDDSGIIRIRARIAKSRRYPVSFDSRDASHLQVATNVDPDGKILPNMVNPWVDVTGTVYDDSFLPSKAGLSEYVKRLGVDYFAFMSI